ncbi:DUF4350 domain-containing protein [Tenacibaculum tangerinum]|uniref:DUF4350 domain-containing protein n=1 Tax=Tenacibaculum tangerinum TaxID=3038772 RepID=A0ABY8L4F7_9FLAO|nr:DUF4350 domain-containing protein [Tenacibaculum tangerinum]WGH76314.1 DUF4350 domain-containing protein [Tenacibaculum tangerinum]
MDKKLKIYSGLLVFMVLGIFYVESVKPKEINWYPSYAAKHKIPYGTYVLHKELPSLFPENEVKDIYQNPYVYLKDAKHNGTYFFVDNKVNFDKDEFNQLLNFVNRGNNVFIATNGIHIDTLKTQTRVLTTSVFEEKAYQKMSNPIFGEKEYHFDRDFSKFYFSEVDTLHTTVLGELVIRNENDSIISKKPNFIKVTHGAGSLYLHTFPQAFTNYNMLLDKNYEYVANVLSYLNSQNQKEAGVASNRSNTILWDTYYKTGKSRITSPMYYILSTPSLKWAYYIALIGVLFFIIFKGKRNQRLIPVITPLKNQTLAFTRTIANMYYEKSAHKNIAEHKINYFLEYIRNQYRLSTLEINERFYKNLTSRSGNSEEKVVALFKRIQHIQTASSITEEDLIALNTAIEDFKAYKK